MAFTKPTAILTRLEDQLTDADSLFKSRFPVARHIAALDRHATGQKYNFAPRQVMSTCSEIAAQFDLSVLETYQKLVMATLISDFDRRIGRKRLPGIVIDLYRQEFARILREFDTNSPGFYQLDNDLFWKDLGLCRTILIPGGVEFVHESSGVPRSILWKAGAGQSLRAFGLFCVELRGFKPFYEIHMDPRRRSTFSPETRVFCYRLVAELLALNPEVKGMFGGSWFYDPALEEISPRLTYLRRVPVQYGAQTFFYRAEDSTSGALLQSETRRGLYAIGHYQPRSHILVWPREHLIRWAAALGELQIDNYPYPDSSTAGIRISHQP
jgi:hypothetical protein